jgi:hypothetical protein
MNRFCFPIVYLLYMFFCIIEWFLCVLCIEYAGLAFYHISEVHSWRHHFTYRGGLEPYNLFILETCYCLYQAKWAVIDMVLGLSI